jgi:hypothetical protein
MAILGTTLRLMDSLAFKCEICGVSFVHFCMSVNLVGVALLLDAFNLTEGSHQLVFPVLWLTVMAIVRQGQKEGRRLTLVVRSMC